MGKNEIEVRVFSNPPALRMICPLDRASGASERAGAGVTVGAADGTSGRGPDLADAFRGIGEQARALSRTLTAARHVGARGEGRDRTGSVRVVVDGTGRVASVHVDHHWTRRMAPYELGEALLAAYREAADAVYERMAEAVEDADDADDAEDAGRDAACGDVPYRLPTEDQLQDRLDRVRARFAELAGSKARAARAPHADEQRSVAGPADLVRVAVTGGQVAAVTVDEDRVADVLTSRLAGDALAAFSAASSS
jgi:DNA-binding protein YbaB